MLAVLMLRGPQTLGELKARTESMHKFASTQEAEEVLSFLMNLAPTPLVTRLERQPGEREPRYAHLLAGTPSPVVRAEARFRGDSRVEKSELEARVENLEAEVRELRAMVVELKRALGA